MKYVERFVASALNVNLTRITSGPYSWIVQLYTEIEAHSRPECTTGTRVEIRQAENLTTSRQIALHPSTKTVNGNEPSGLQTGP